MLFSKQTLIGTGISFILSTSLMADSNIYINGSYQFLGAEDDTVLGIQPTDELIGGDLDVYKIGIGVELKPKQNQKSKDFAMNGTRFGIYASFSNSWETDISAGLDFTIKDNDVNFWGFVPYFGGNFGIGWRDDGGKRYQTSTSVNKVTYVSEENLDQFKVSDVAIMQEDTTWIELGFSIGVEYSFSKNFSLNGGYVFQNREYQVSYRLQNSEDVLNSLDIDQKYNGFEFSLNYKF